MMHILIDVQGCQSGSRFRGIGRSTLSMSRSIIKNKKNHRISILLNGMYPLDQINEVKYAFNDILPFEEMFIFSGVKPISYFDKNNHVRNTFAAEIRDIAIANINPDIVYVTGFFEGYWDDYIVTVPKSPVSWKTICVCHDLIPLLNKSFYFSDSQFGNWYIKKLVNYNLSDAILTVSESARNEMVNNTSYPSKKIINISSSVDDKFKVIKYSDKQKERLIKTYCLPEYFIMSIAIYEPRKNITALIKAYGGLNESLRQKYPLLLTYNLDKHEKFEFENLARKNNITSLQLIFTGYLPDEDLIALYNLCTIFIFPSIHEGFGLPVLEAMKCGAAVLCSNTTSMPEIVNCSDATFDPYDITAIRDKIFLALTDNNFYQQLKKNALVQAAKFSSDKLAKKILSYFSSLVSNNKNAIVSDTFSVKKFTNNIINNIKNNPKVNELDRFHYAWAIAQNSFISQRKKILLDISELVQRDNKSGIQRVSRSILYELLNGNISNYEVRAVYYVNFECYRYANNFVKKNYGIDFGEDEPVLFNHNDIMLVIDLTISFFPQVLPSFDKALRAGSRIYFIIHDILPIQNPEWSSDGMQCLFPKWLKSVTTYGTGVICVSASVADDVKKWINLNKNLNINKYLTVNYFHLGANLKSSFPVETTSSYSAEYFSKIFNTHPIFLMVGTLEPRKSYADVLASFELLWDEGYTCQLVIVGKYGWIVDKLVNHINNHPQLHCLLHWLQDISDASLEELYKYSDALIFASKGEGFGLPLIEAAKKGLPLILRDIPVFREIAGENALYFSGDGVDPIYNVIKLWISLNNRNIAPSSIGIKWITWKKSAKFLLSKLQLVKGTEFML